MNDEGFRIAMIGGPVDGEISTLVARTTLPATTIGVPQFHLGPLQIAWYDRLGSEPVAGRWGFVYRETSGPESALRAVVGSPQRVGVSE